MGRPGGEPLAPWWLSIQGVPVALVLALLGHAWADTLRGRLRWAPRAALAGVALVGLALAVANARATYAALPFFASFALGAALRLPRDGDAPPAPLWIDLGLAATLTLAAWAVTLWWSFALLSWGFVVVCVLLALRILVVDPLVAARRRRAAEGAPAEPLSSPAQVGDGR